MNAAAPTPNLPLLRKVTDWAETEAAKPNPQERLWYQRSWAMPADCGTSYCVAGYVVVTAHPAAEQRCSGWGDYDLYIDGELASWGDEAQILLGLTDREADRLFIGCNDVGDIRRVAEEIAARAGERL